MTGSIPSSLGNLTNAPLRTFNPLRLYNNQLTGAIPAALCRFESGINPQQGGVNLPGCGGDSEQDRAVLVEFYNATNGQNWTVNTNWNSSASLDQWHGVSTDSNGRVRDLQLRENKLSGAVPSSLGSLTNLEVLDLIGNSLTGSLSSSLGSLTNLEWLSLVDNQLTGSIPPSLGSLTNLTGLRLSNNQLTGSIPPSLSSLTNLTGLHLSNNELTGSIPSSLGSLTNLTCFNLGSNELTGSIPSSLGSLTNLTCFNLGSNELTGSIPSSLGSLTNLDELFLDNNQLTGSIPSSLGNLTNAPLRTFDPLRLYNNQLTGAIPAALCRFESGINPQQGGVNLPCEPSAAAQSLAALSVGDARAEEAAVAAVAFAVTLSRAAADPVTVDYATRDGSARAGEDYAAASGTLTFAPGESSKTVEVAVLDDAHDEGEETFVLALSNASGARLEDADATGTIENTDLLPSALIARFGRATAEHVVEHVEERMAKPREPGLRARFAGREVGPGMERDFALDFLSQFGQPAGMNAMGASPMGSHTPGVGLGPPGMAGQDLRMGGAAFLLDHGASGGGDVLGSALPGGDLLSGSEFELNRAQHGGVISVWSRSARSSFGGRQGALSLNGDVRTTMLGADYTRGRLVAGLSLARSQGLGGYDGRHAGQVESSATGLYPWLGYRVNDRVSVWGVTGYGAGALRLTPDRATALESGLSMAMAAAGTRGELVGSRASGGFALAFKADALWVGTSVDGVDSAAGRLSASDAAVTRIRTGIEGSRGFSIGGRMALTPSVEVGLRQDGGDAETGTGVDVGGGPVVHGFVDGPVAGRAGAHAGRAPGGRVHGAGDVAVVRLEPEAVEPAGFRGAGGPVVGRGRPGLRGAVERRAAVAVRDLRRAGGGRPGGCGAGLRPAGRPALRGHAAGGLRELGLRARLSVRLPPRGARGGEDGLRGRGGRASPGEPDAGRRRPRRSGPGQRALVNVRSAIGNATGRRWQRRVSAGVTAGTPVLVPCEGDGLRPLSRRSSWRWGSFRRLTVSHNPLYGTLDQADPGSLIL